MTIPADRADDLKTSTSEGLASFPPTSQWEDWEEGDPRADAGDPDRHYTLVPTLCFNCESACGLLAYVDRETLEVRKLEGQPLHPASRGRNCPKGPATVNQMNNPDRILHPLKRVGPRGGGRWEQVTWEEALADIGPRIRKAISEERRDAVVYHVGRPGEDMYTERVLQCWGIDGHNSHTNVCSAGARAGYAFWMGIDRPNPDFANARFILMISSHLEAGHYFNPHAQRIVEAKLQGTRICAVDARLSNTASQADIWLAPWPGTEAGMLLAMANHLLQSGLVNFDFLRKWVNWSDLLEDQDYLNFLRNSGGIESIPADSSFDSFIALLKELYAGYTLEWAEGETGVPATDIKAVAEEIGKAGEAFASHVWRSAAAGHLGGWMVARCLFFLNVLSGSVGTPGGTIPNSWTKFVPQPFSLPPPLRCWNETNWPLEFPLAHMEMSFLLPHLLKERGKRLDVYFTRVYNPVWTNPDGLSWVEMLEGEDIGLHVSLTPVWCETAQWADYVLPMGLGSERHDLVSYETHSAQWLGFRQPVVRVAKERLGQELEDTRDANPGQVWEENEFWIELSWHIDPDGSMGIRQYFESPYRTGEKIKVDEYYRYIFENSVPGLREKAEDEGLDPMQYMRRYGAFEVTNRVYNQQDQPLPQELVDSAQVDPSTGLLWSETPAPRVNFRPYPGPFNDDHGRVRLGIEVDGRAVQGFPTPSGKLEFYSTTLNNWGWPEYALPVYPLDADGRERMTHLVSQVHWSKIDRDNSEYCLLPTFRLPTLIHSRTNGAKWLHEISHINPVWINTIDARQMGVSTGDLVKVETEIGHFIDRVWVTEAIHPGVVACSHHLGRWRRFEDHGSDRWNSALVNLERQGDCWQMRQKQGVMPWKSSDPDTERLWWSDGGVHQNLTFPVQPDPISGQHCWHQKVRVSKASGNDRYGDVVVNTETSHQVYKRWLSQCRSAPGPEGLRRPLWLMRPLKPHPDAFRV